MVIARLSFQHINKIGFYDIGIAKSILIESVFERKPDHVRKFVLNNTEKGYIEKQKLDIVYQLLNRFSGA
jgi:hypothetical protein